MNKWIIEYRGTNRRTFLDEFGYITEDIDNAELFNSKEEAEARIADNLDSDKSMYKVIKILH